ncbi:hypothetical protein Tco_0911133 [Tanacetum coccineum]|uniref:Uncharacterized protein n=1 Tax=Tanacetum coccineum TaxID=301880 RepID=A0ABQ5CX30_9ASTR
MNSSKMVDLAFVKQHNMVAYLEMTKENADFHQILDFLTSSSKKIHANVDGKVVVVLESSVRRDLHLNDEDGTACLTTNEIFENLALMGYEPASDKLTFYKGKGFPGRITPLFQNMLVPPVVVGDEAINEEMFDSVERAATTASSLEAEHASGNINKTQFTATLNEPFSLELGLGSGPWRQETMVGMQDQTRSEGVSNLSSDPPLSGGHTLRSGEDSMEHQIKLTDNVPNTPHDSPLRGVNTPGSNEGSLELTELMDLVTKPSHMVLDLEKVKTAQAKEIERKHLKTQFGKDTFDDIDDLVDEGMAFIQDKDAKNQGKIGADDTEVVKGSGDAEVNTAGKGVSIANVSETISTAAPRTPPTTTTVFDDEDVSMAMAQTLIKMKEEKAKDKGVVLKDVEDSSRPVRSITTLQPLPTIDPKDKGKGILQETKSIEKTKKKVQGDAQVERDAERIQDFTPIDSEKEAQKPGKRLKRVTGSYETQKSLKKPKVMKFAKDVTEKEVAEYEKEKEELRADGSLSYHGDTQAFLRRLDRQDLNDLYRIIFDPNEKDELWLNQLDWKLLRWKLYESCGVHTLFMDGTPIEINMLLEKK